MNQDPDPRRPIRPAVRRDRRKTAALELIASNSEDQRVHNQYIEVYLERSVIALELIAARTIEPERIAAAIEQFERIGDNLERAVIALDSIATALSLQAVSREIARRYIGTTQEPAPPGFYCPNCKRNIVDKAGAICAICEQTRVVFEPADPELTAAPFPHLEQVPHVFHAVEGNRYCGRCGGGRLHPIHTPQVQHEAPTDADA